MDRCKTNVAIKQRRGFSVEEELLFRVHRTLGLEGEALSR